MTTSTTGAAPVAALPEVLDALSDPIRLEMVRRLAAEGGPVACSQLYEGIGKSTASHHFKTLREAGIIERTVRDGHTFQNLRVDEVEQALPGVLTAIIAATD